MSDKMVERKDKMKYVNIDDIILEERARKDMGNIEELAATIKEKGVIQPITLDEKMVLQAGHRRYTAAKLAGLTKIPAIIRPFVDIVDSTEIELMENVYRKDFTWSERALLTKKIDDYYKEHRPNWSGRKTAELIDKSVGSVSTELQLARYIEAVPELANVKTADDALKMIKKMEADVITKELTNRQKAAMAAPEKDGPVKALQSMLKRADANYQIIDCFTEMAQLRSGGFFHFIECDPPYGIDLNAVKAGKDSIGSTVTGYEEVPADKYHDFLKKLTKELYRIAYKDAWMVFWYGPTWHNEVITTLKEAGWLVDDIPAIWAKYSGQTLQPELYLARSYEPFFICRKGNPVLNKRGRLNVFNFAGCPTNGPDAKYHPTQRPVELIEEILDTFTVGQQNVFIPFLGSGATLRACYNKGLNGMGCDLDGKYKDKFMLAVEADTRKVLSND